MLGMALFVHFVNASTNGFCRAMALKFAFVVAIALVLLPAIVFCLDDPYKALGLSKTASQEEIKQAFKFLSKKWYDYVLIFWGDQKQLILIISCVGIQIKTTILKNHKKSLWK